MEIAIYNKTFEQWQQDLDTELVKSTEGFVRIGYLLKVARDTDILKESGYDSIVDFAKARYGLDKTQVSRFIHINDRFSEGGNSEYLLEQYKGMGYAKLSIMLQLPDSVNEEISTGFTKSEILSIKEELDEESKITDLEVMMEDKSEVIEAIDNNLAKFIHQLGQDDHEMFECMHCQYPDITIDSVKDDMCPNDEKIYMARIPGMGRMMLSLKCAETTVKLINARTGEKEEYFWQQLVECWKSMYRTDESVELAYKRCYGVEMAVKNEEVAPVQPKSEPKKESKVSKPKKAAEPKPESIAEPKEANEEQIPGQDTIVNHPEYLPSTETTASEVEVMPIDPNITRGWKASIRNCISRMDALYNSMDWQKIKELAQDIIWKCDKMLNSLDTEGNDEG